MKIWKEKDEKKEEGFLMLKEDGNGDVTLTMVDEYGDRMDQGNILWITKNGKLSRYGLCKAPGIKTNSDGEIEIDED